MCFLDHDKPRPAAQTIRGYQTTYADKPSFNLLWVCGGEVRHLAGKRGGDRRAGRMKWDWCWLLEEAHSTRQLGLGDNLLLVCENKMWSHTWLLFLLSHLLWARMKMTCGWVRVCPGVYVCVCSACGHCLAPYQIKKSTRADRLALKLRRACRHTLLTGSPHRGRWILVTRLA